MHKVTWRGLMGGNKLEFQGAAFQAARRPVRLFNKVFFLAYETPWLISVKHLIFEDITFDYLPHDLLASQRVKTPRGSNLKLGEMHLQAQELDLATMFAETDRTGPASKPHAIAAKVCSEFPDLSIDRPSCSWPWSISITNPYLGFISGTPEGEAWTSSISRTGSYCFNMAHSLVAQCLSVRRSILPGWKWTLQPGTFLTMLALPSGGKKFVTGNRIMDVRPIFPFSVLKLSHITLYSLQPLRTQSEAES